MSKSLLQRRHETDPKYAIHVSITGITIPDGKIHWHVVIDGEHDRDLAARIFEVAAEIVRDGAGEEF